MLSLLLAVTAFKPNLAPPDDLTAVGETHLSHTHQLTFGGQNAEAYWNFEGTKLSYQTMQPQYPDEQIFTMGALGEEKRLISTGRGRCTCSYFSPDGQWIYFSSTHATEPGPQAPVDRSKGYVWRVNQNYALYRVRPDGSQLQPIITKPGAYVAETTIAPNGKYMVWTSDFEGDLEIYRSDLNGGHIRRLTNEVGYDGGPFVSWDSKHIVYRRQAVNSPAEEAEYKQLLSEHLVRPTKLEIWVMDADGKNKRQVTHLGCASFAPFMHPDEQRIVFSSNYGDPKGREFDIFIINIDGSGLERITHSPEFDGFPMFTRDGKRLVFASNRNGKAPRETNLFVSDWNE